MRIMKDSERLCYQSFHAQLCSVLPKDNEESKVCRCKSILSTNWKDLWWNWREIWRNDQTDSCSKDWKWSQGRSEASTCWLLLQTIFLQDLKNKIIFCSSLKLLCARDSLNLRFPMKYNLKSWLAGRGKKKVVWQAALEEERAMPSSRLCQDFTFAGHHTFFMPYHWFFIGLSGEE